MGIFSYQTVIFTFECTSSYRHTFCEHNCISFGHLNRQSIHENRNANKKTRTTATDDNLPHRNWDGRFWPIFNIQYSIFMHSPNWKTVEPKRFRWFVNRTQACESFNMRMLFWFTDSFGCHTIQLDTIQKPPLRFNERHAKSPHCESNYAIAINCKCRWFVIYDPTFTH